MIERLEKKVDQVLDRLGGIEKTQIVHASQIQELATRLGETRGRIAKQDERLEPVEQHVVGVRFLFGTLVVAVSALAGAAGFFYSALRITGALK